MTSLSDALSGDQGSQIHAALAAGVDVLSGDQEVLFVPYVRQILPLDGSVFFLNAALLSPEQLAQHQLPSADPIAVRGSLHYASVGSQAEDETIIIRSVDFTSETLIDALAEVAPTVLYIASWFTPWGGFKFTFSRRNSYYKQANLHHLIGDAVYPVFETQLIESLSDFDQRQVVSNSLPIWLAMFDAIPFVSLITVDTPRFPSFLVADDLVPPYASIHIGEADTRSLQTIPWRGPTSTHQQLCADRVQITTYGLRNDEAMDFFDYILDYSENTGLIGIMSMTPPRDGKRSQLELTALAQQKVIEFEVSYQQSSSRNVARQLIKQAVSPALFISENPLEPFAPPIVPPVPVGPPLVPRHRLVPSL